MRKGMSMGLPAETTSLQARSRFRLVALLCVLACLCRREQAQEQGYEGKQLHWSVGVSPDLCGVCACVCCVGTCVCICMVGTGSRDARRCRSALS